MAPSIAQAPPSPSPKKLRTSGQLDPIYSLLRPYSDFPSAITGPTLWHASDYASNSDAWVHRWTKEEIAAIGEAADKFMEEGKRLTEITRENFVLKGELRDYLEKVRKMLVDGRGFGLWKGLPVDEWGVEKAAVAYMGIGTYLGYFVSQNSRGHILGHVKDLGEDSRQIDKVRIYRTNARQFFHCDDSDLVGLLCITRAMRGGESDIVSAHHVFNTLQRERPDIVRTLCEPNWYFDRKGEVSKGQKEWIRSSVFYFYDDRVYVKWDPYYVKSLTRFSDKGLIPALTPEQLEAAEVLEETCNKLALHMVLEVGDIQFVSNTHCLHARTAYEDHPWPAPRRHLMRLWLATPEGEGGWRLPFTDSKEKKRGGIQVDEQEEVSPFDAE
ncbi:Clavaminate synthase-like protein [Ascodesmis nigricans]|uniref:Clavaminate synthase-like protein n=1 Tax=Ascodesmis nigricans TaxID=341454 RepID=A0A4S2MSC5_9PEZI|nr:Clavaminate synthase-like protein [Ascodesmis nigricans]